LDTQYLPSNGFRAPTLEQFPPARTQDDGHVIFPELQCESVPGHFRSGCIQDRRLRRSARFRSGKSLPSAVVQACVEKFPTRPLNPLLLSRTNVCEIRETILETVRQAQ